MDEAGPDALRITDQFHFPDPGNQLLEENSHFESCQDQAKTLVRAGTESKMAVRFSLDIELEGLVENILIKTS